jgi:hypothetical protein
MAQEKLREHHNSYPRARLDKALIGEGDTWPAGEHRGIIEVKSARWQEDQLYD